jgi:hypothetical protein
MKYTLEFLRENLLVGGRPLTPPPDFSSNSDSSRRVNGAGSGEHHHATQSGSDHARGSKAPKPERTRPCDTALNERVIRQQYALYEAEVENTRKRKDLPAHIVQRVEAAAEQSSQHLLAKTEQVNQLEAARANQANMDPRQRWDVLNGGSTRPYVYPPFTCLTCFRAILPAEPPNIQGTQDNFTRANRTICELIQVAN